jgi:tripartite-type tricarboxylate transporter receptor subunit TctC
MLWLIPNLPLVAAASTTCIFTLLLHHIGMATSPALYRKMPYNTTDDFEYLGMVNDVPMTLIGRPTLPANNYKELQAWIEQKIVAGS